MLTPMMDPLHGGRDFNHFMTKSNFITIEILKAIGKEQKLSLNPSFDKTYIDLTSIDEIIHVNVFCVYFSFIPSTGHYTQMVWAKTNKVGCGSIAWKEGAFIKQYLVCNYGPAGNTLRQPMYQIGNACSRCPTGSSCSNGLCTAVGGSSGSSLFPNVNRPTPSISVSIAPTNRPAVLPPRRPIRPVISQTQPLEFGFVPMLEPLQDPRPVQRPALAIEPQQVNNDISVQNLLQPIQNIIPNPPSPAQLLSNSPVLPFNPSSNPSRPQNSQRRPRNCSGMLGFMCRLLG